MVDARQAPVATVLITTKDRCDVLRSAIQSVMGQDICVELIVVDDGSTDGTSEMVSREFPNIRLIRNKKPLGIIAARNEAAKLVNTEIMFTLDDDAVYTGADTISRVLKHFDHPNVGAVTIPLVNIIGGRKERHHFVEWAGDDDFPCASSFVGCANALRIDLFRKLGGYSGVGRQGEERNYSLRMLSHGFVVRIADAPPVHHFPEHHLDRAANDKIIEAGARNNIIFAWEYVPFPELLVHLGGIIVNILLVMIRERRFKAGISGLVGGFVSLLWVKRHPVSSFAFRLHRRLVATSPMRFSKIEVDIRKLKDFSDHKDADSTR